MSKFPSTIVNDTSKSSNKIKVEYEDIPDIKEILNENEDGAQGFIPFVNNNDPHPDRLYISSGLGVQITQNEEGQDVLNTLINKLTSLQGGPVESYGYNEQPHRHDHLVTKRYVDSLARGLDHKQNCKLTDKVDVRVRLKDVTATIAIDGIDYNFVNGAAVDMDPESGPSDGEIYIYETTKPSYFLIKKEDINNDTKLLDEDIFTDRNHRLLIRFGIFDEDSEDMTIEELVTTNPPTSAISDPENDFYWHRDTTHVGDGNAAKSNGIYNIIYSGDTRLSIPDSGTLTDTTDWCIIHRTLDFELGYDVIGAYTTVEKNVNSNANSNIDTKGKAFYVFNPNPDDNDLVENGGEVIVGHDEIHFTVSHGIDYNQGTNIVIDKDTNRISVTDDVFLQGTLQVQGTTRLQDTLTVQGFTNLQNNVTIQDALNVQGTSNLQGPTTLQDTLTVYRSSSLQGTTLQNLHVNETSILQGATIYNTLSIPVIPVTGDNKVAKIYIESTGDPDCHAVLKFCYGNETFTITPDLPEECCYYYDHNNNS